MSQATCCTDVYFDLISMPATYYGKKNDLLP